jgi:chromosome segregation ATPase
MILRAPTLAAVALALAVGGCASLSSDSPESSSSGSSSNSGSAENRSSGSDSRRSETTDSRRAENTDSRRSDSGAESTASNRSTTANADGPRSSWRAERENQRETRTSASAGNAGGGAENAKLVEQLNDATRELATLRAANAKLRAERSQPASASTSSASRVDAARPDPADEKLAASMKSYSQFRQDILGLLADIERMRRENAGLNSDLKAALAQADQARNAMSRLESDLRAERKSRAEAEHAAAQLREQLRSIGKALTSAGLNPEKFSGSSDSATRE